MNTRPFFRAVPRNRMRGMSLIETMVGMTLGILVSLIITQVWGVFENQKQRTVSATAGQASGLLALTELEQDVRSAGAGLTDPAMLNCGSIFSYYESGGVVVSPIPAYASLMELAPVRIQDGGGATSSDTVIVKRSSEFLAAIPATLIDPVPTPSSQLNVSNTSVLGFAAGDIVLVAGATTGNCTVAQLTAVPTVTSLQFSSGPITYNPPAAYQTLNSWPAYAKDDKVIKIGQLLSRSYTVNAASRELTVTDSTGVPTAVVTTTSALASDIVMLKAQYGVASVVGSQNVDTWVSATPLSTFNVLDGAKVRSIKAVRVVIVARSAKMEVPGTTTVAPVAWPDAASPVIDLSTTSPDWTRYRYRTYQLVIPIRNVIWANV